MKRFGFTLVELLVVIGIIGILMTIGVYAFGSAAKRSRDDTRKSDLARLKNVLQQHYLDVRSYPAFDHPGSVPIYSATWQLSKDVSGCNHTTDDFLTTRYIATIPEDPLQKTAFTKENCAALAQDQNLRYLYLTNTTANGPVDHPTAFGLMAHLENPGADQVSANNNPLISNSTNLFGPWYAQFGNYDQGGGIHADANYLVTGNIGR